MIPEKILHEPDPGVVLLDPQNIVPEKLFTSIETTELEAIKYSSQDTENSLKPFKIDKTQPEEDGSTTVYYSVSHSSVPTETETRTATTVGSINMPIYDEAEAEKLIFESLINKGWYS